MFSHQVIFLLFILNITLSSDILDPSQIRSLMFTDSITGVPEVLIPEKQERDADGKVTMEKYRISM